MSVTTDPFYDLEGKEVTIFTCSGRKIEGIYFGVATHGWHVVELASDPAGRVDRREFIPFDRVESVQIVALPPEPHPTAARVTRGEYR